MSATGYASDDKVLRSGDVMTGNLELLGTPPLTIPAGAAAGYVATADAAGNVSWAASGRPATVTVGFSGADFICTGTHDGAVIQAAVSSLPAGGGKILIRNSPVPYDFSAATDCVTLAKPNVTIEGEAYGGVTFRAGAAIFTAGHAQYGMLTVGRTQASLLSNVTLRNLIFDCNHQFNTAGLCLDGGSALTGQPGLQNVLLENVTVRNQVQNIGATGGEHASGATIQSGLNTSVGNRGYVDRVTFRRCEFGPSNQDGFWFQGTNITHILWTECYVHDCQGNGALIFDYGNGGITSSDWTVEKCRFENNMITSQAGSHAHFRDQTQVGVNNFSFTGNYVGPAVNSGASQDYIVTPYSAANTKITGNLFDRCGAGISIGLSHAGSEYRYAALNRVIIEDNVFYALRSCFDPDAAVFVHLKNNIFYRIKGSPVLSPYSEHWPTVIEGNTFYDINDANLAAGTSRAVLRQGGNGFVIRNNQFIDDRKMPDPAGASNLALTQTAGGSQGARTYYVRYTWSNSSGETLASAEQSLAISAGNLLVIDAAQTGPGGTNLPPGAQQINYYAASASGAETLQASVAVPALSYAWTEPATGLITGASPPAANTTANLTDFGINEGAGGAGTLAQFASIYEGNRFYGIPSGSEIVTFSGYSHVSRGNVTNPTMTIGGDFMLPDTDLTLAALMQRVYCV